MPAPSRPQKITFGEMCDTGVRGVLVHCSDFHCGHSIAVSADKESASRRTCSANSAALDRYLFLDKAKFRASFATDESETKAAFMADSQVQRVSVLSPARMPSLRGKPSRAGILSRPRTR
jgi:hypothetical protein